MCPAWWYMPLMPETGGEGRTTLFLDSLLQTWATKWDCLTKTIPTEITGYLVIEHQTSQDETLSLCWCNWNRKPGGHTGETSSLFKICLFVSDTSGAMSIMIKFMELPKEKSYSHISIWIKQNKQQTNKQAEKPSLVSMPGKALPSSAVYQLDCPQHR